MISALQGIYAAAVTPRRLGTQDINLGAMWELIDFLVGHGVQGIVLLGTTGEFIHFSNAERMRLMGVAVKRSKTPVVFNCSHSTFDGAVELTQAADASGAAAALIMPPYFFPYDAHYDEQGYTWTGGIYADRVARLNVESGEWVYYLLPFTANIRDIDLKPAQPGGLSGVWFGHTPQANLTLVEPLSR